jgi:hypothetical protein
MDHGRDDSWYRVANELGILAKNEMTTYQTRIRVFSIDNHPFLREGIATVVNAQPDMLVVAQAADGQAAIEAPGQTAEECSSASRVDRPSTEKGPEET